MSSPDRPKTTLRPAVLISFAVLFALAAVGLAGPWAASEADNSRPDTAGTGRGTDKTESDADTAGTGRGTGDVDGRQTELDRLIAVFTARAEERQGSLEYRRLGDLLLERAGERSALGDYRAALNAYTTALAIDPDHPDSLVGQGRAALGVHDFATALGATDRLAQADRDEPEHLALIGDVAYAVGDYAGATAAVAVLADAVGADPAVLVRRAQLAAVGPGADTARAEVLAAQAIAGAEELGLDPATLAFYQTYAGRLAFDRGDHPAAAGLLERALANAPDDQGTLGELARVRAATGDVDQAIELLVRANELVPEPDHLVLLGDVRMLAGQHEAAQLDYRAAVALATADDDHRRAWARSLATYHLDHEGNLAVAGEIVAAERDVRSDVGIHDLSGWLAYRRGDLVEARAAIDRALGLGQPPAVVWYHAAVISAAEGDHRRAASEIEAALTTNPGFDPLLAIDAHRLAADLGVVLGNN